VISRGEFISPDGLQRHYQVAKFPLGQEHGFDDAIATIGLDITGEAIGRKQLEVLSRIGAVLGEHVDASEAFQRLSRLVVPDVADGCSLFMRDDAAAGAIKLVGARHVDPHAERAYREAHALTDIAGMANDARAAHRDVFHTGQPVVRTNISNSGEATAAWMRPRDLDEPSTFADRSSMHVPVLERGRVTAVLAFFTSRSSGRRYVETDLAFAGEVATRFGIALENDRLLTERARAVDELRRANEELEQRVTARTAELSRQNEALAEARAEADRANSTKSAFLARMSHEIRTPMNGVLGMATLLLETKLTTQQHETVETLRASADALLTILNEILDFSKIEAGKVSLETQPFNVYTCVKDSIDLFSGTASRKRLTLTLEFEDNVPRGIEGDPTRLRQVLTNLIGNAVKFTERGGVRVLVSCERKPTDSDVVLHFEVRDTGIGMTSEARARLFSPFMQAHESTSRIYGGTGLGLSIAKQLVEVMTGYIDVQSAPGVGTSFHAVIPFRVATLEGSSAKSPSGFDANLGKGAPLRVLLAEDNLVNQKVAVRMLELFGYVADIATNGAEAVAAISARPYDLVLMDMHMPEVDGLEATRRIRQMRFPWGRPRVVAMTASSFVDDRNACIDAGMDDFVSKPVTAQELGDALRRAAGALGPSPARQYSMKPPDSRIERAQWVSGLDEESFVRLEALMGKGSTELTWLIRRFIENATRAASDVSRALADGNAEAIYGIAHQLTASSGMLGATALSELYRSLMNAASEKDAIAMEHLADAVRREMTTVVDSLSTRAG
jgi:signal transduction histidine kinase/CheY-like chemotaxis protein/HPt (histidine-containing phosphotransfer) domain-containing protein